MGERLARWSRQMHLVSSPKRLCQEWSRESCDMHPRNMTGAKCIAEYLRTGQEYLLQPGSRTLTSSMETFIHRIRVHRANKTEGKKKRGSRFSRCFREQLSDGLPTAASGEHKEGPPTPLCNMALQRGKGGLIEDRSIPSWGSNRAESKREGRVKTMGKACRNLKYVDPAHPRNRGAHHMHGPPKVCTRQSVTQSSMQEQWQKAAEQRKPDQIREAGSDLAAITSNADRQI